MSLSTLHLGAGHPLVPSSLTALYFIYTRIQQKLFDRSCLGGDLTILTTLCNDRAVLYFFFLSFSIFYCRRPPLPAERTKKMEWTTERQKEEDRLGRPRAVLHPVVFSTSPHREWFLFQLPHSSSLPTVSYIVLRRKKRKGWVLNKGTNSLLPFLHLVFFFHSTFLCRQLCICTR